MKTLTLKARFFAVALLATLTFAACSDEDENSTSPYAGTWVRIVGASGDRTDIAIGGISGEDNDRVYMCEKQGSSVAGLYKGTLSGNTIYWDSEYNLPSADLSIEGGDLVLDYTSCSQCLPTTYVKGSWSGECTLGSGGGGGGSSAGDVTFWNNDANVGVITVVIGGSSSGITSNVNPAGCGESGCANFTLSAGNYSFTASATTGETWSGNCTVTANGCLKFNLH